MYVNVRCLLIVHRRVVSELMTRILVFRFHAFCSWSYGLRRDYILYIIHQGSLQWFTGVSNHSEARKNIFFYLLVLSLYYAHGKYIISLTRIIINITILC
jgi:hypothetical protein